MLADVLAVVSDFSTLIGVLLSISLALTVADWLLDKVRPQMRDDGGW